jgi:hypothetical protein
VNVEMQQMSDALTTRSGQPDGRRGCREWYGRGLRELKMFIGLSLLQHQKMH